MNAARAGKRSPRGSAWSGAPDQPLGWINVNSMRDCRFPAINSFVGRRRGSVVEFIVQAEPDQVFP
jgi:hypothetical protein